MNDVQNGTGAAHSAPSLGAMFPRELEPEALRSYARTVERLGYDELWVVEDCFWTGAISSTAVALAATERLRVGIGVMPAVMRNPATVAMELAALVRYFPGRVLPGFGHGVTDWMRQIGALPSSQLAALEETTDAVRRLLRGETLTTQGRHVTFDSVRLDHPPVEVPPISLGVRGPKSLQLSGRVADGTLVDTPSAPAYLRWARAQIDAGRAEAGRTDPHRITAYAWIDAGAESAAVRRTLAELLLSPESASRLAPLGIAEDAAELTSRYPDVDSLAPELPTDWVRMLSVSGDPDERAAAIAARADAGADSVVLVPSTADPQEALAQLELARS